VIDRAIKPPSQTKKEVGRIIQTDGPAGIVWSDLQLEFKLNAEIEALEPNVPSACGRHRRLIANDGHIGPPNKVVTDIGPEIGSDLVPQVRSQLRQNADARPIGAGDRRGGQQPARQSGRRPKLQGGPHGGLNEPGTLECLAAGRNLLSGTAYREFSGTIQSYPIAVPTETGADLATVKLIMSLEHVNGTHMYGSTIFGAGSGLIRVGFHEGEVSGQGDGFIKIHVAKTYQGVNRKASDKPNRPPKIRFSAPQTEIGAAGRDRGQQITGINVAAGVHGKIGNNPGRQVSSSGQAHVLRARGGEAAFLIEEQEASLEAAAMRLVKPDSSGQAEAGPSVGAVQASARVDPGASE